MTAAARSLTRAPPSLALEQPKAELNLELEDLAAERRLAHVAGGGGPAEMAMLGDRDQIFQVPQIHKSL